MCLRVSTTAYIRSLPTPWRALSTWAVEEAESWLCDTRGMKEKRSSGYAGHRFPPEIIGHAVWRHCRLALRYRDVGERRAERGLTVGDETSRRWCVRFGRAYATALRRRRPRPGDSWPRDAVSMRIGGRPSSRWRAGDRDGAVLATPVQSRRATRAATRFVRALLTGRRYAPRVAIAAKRASAGAATRDPPPRVEQRRHTGPHNRAEHARRPTRARAAEAAVHVAGARPARPRRVGPARRPLPPAPPPPHHRRPPRDPGRALRQLAQRAPACPSRPARPPRRAITCFRAAPTPQRWLKLTMPARAPGSVPARGDEGDLAARLVFLTPAQQHTRVRVVPAVDPGRASLAAGVRSTIVSLHSRPCVVPGIGPPRPRSAAYRVRRSRLASWSGQRGAVQGSCPPRARRPRPPARCSVDGGGCRAAAIRRAPRRMPPSARPRPRPAPPRGASRAGAGPARQGAGPAAG